jgi:hypothetical protein
MHVQITARSSIQIPMGHPITRVVYKPNLFHAMRTQELSSELRTCLGVEVSTINHAEMQKALVQAEVNRNAASRFHPACAKAIGLVDAVARLKFDRFDALPFCLSFCILHVACCICQANGANQLVLALGELVLALDMSLNLKPPCELICSLANDEMHFMRIQLELHLAFKLAFVLGVLVLVSVLELSSIRIRASRPLNFGRSQPWQVPPVCFARCSACASHLALWLFAGLVSVRNCTWHCGRLQ